MSNPYAVIVLAAGAGTRMKSELPKVVHPIAGVPMLGHALRAAAAQNPQHVVAVVRHQRDVVVSVAREALPGVVIADQDEIPGTGRAVQCGLEALADLDGDVQGTVVVTSGDVPMLGADTIAHLVQVHEDSGNAATVLSTELENPTGYGRIVRDGQAVVGIVQDDLAEHTGRLPIRGQPAEGRPSQVDLRRPRRAHPR